MAMASDDVLKRVLAIRVDFRDPDAAAEITPTMAAAYLTARGWTVVREEPYTTMFGNLTECVFVPRAGRDDYGRRMLDLLADLAKLEGRSSLAVWIDLRGMRAA